MYKRKIKKQEELVTLLKANPLSTWREVSSEVEELESLKTAQKYHEEGSTTLKEDSARLTQKAISHLSTLIQTLHLLKQTQKQLINTKGGV
jgi:hypothetical protein